MPAAVLLLFVTSVGLAQGSPEAEESTRAFTTGDLPVSRVVLFTSGVGYFEHFGTVDGNVEVELPVAGDQMDDLLQSLVLQDFDGGSVEAVRYPSRDPLPRVLDSYSLDLAGDQSLAGLLSQARGERVEVEAGETLRGMIVGVEQVRVPELEPRTYLTLATEDGLRRLSLEEVRRISFEREALQAELDAALAALAEYRGGERGTVRLRFSGEGTRRVSVGYVREMPVWKTSYRLLVVEDGETILQGWAIFDNPTQLDLEDVAVSFVAGQPLSFIADLFDPVYVERPRVETATAPGVVPPAYGGDFAGAPALQGEMAEALRAVAPAPARMEGAGADGVRAQTQGRPLGASFEYRVDGLVTIPRFESAMIPIVQEQVTATELSIYDPSLLPNHPLRGVLLENSTSLHLAAGPVTVFVDGVFAGNAQLSDLLPGDSRMLAYAVDLQVSATTESNREPERMVAASLRNGRLELSLRSRLVTEYRFDQDLAEGRPLIVEHPLQPGYQLVSPREASRTDSGYRFRIALGAAEGAEGGEAANVPEAQLDCLLGEPCVLPVVEERVDLTVLSLADMTGDDIAFYLENVELSAEDQELLDRVAELKSRQAALEREIAGSRSRLEAIHRDQDRIRQNMSALDRDSSLYRRYLSELEAQEDLIDEIEGSLAETQDQLTVLREEIITLLETTGATQ